MKALLSFKKFNVIVACAQSASTYIMCMFVSIAHDIAKSIQPNIMVRVIIQQYCNSDAMA